MYQVVGTRYHQEGRKSVTVTLYDTILYYGIRLENNIKYNIVAVAL